MAKVAMNMKGIPDADASTKAANAVTNCAGTQLATPAPPEVAALDAAQQDFASAVADQVTKVSAAQAATVLKNEKRADLEAAYAAVGGKVQTISSGDPAFIMARGFDVVSTGGPITYGQVTGMIATPGDVAGQIHWMCDPQAGALFLVQTSPAEAPAIWTPQEPSKKSKGDINGMPSLTRVMVRAAAKGSNNTGAWSDPAFVIVP